MHSAVFSASLVLARIVTDTGPRNIPITKLLERQLGIRFLPG